jgi:hypothetical protein
MEKQRVWSSAGSEFAGMGLAPQVLQDLGGIVAELTPSDSAARRNADEIHRYLRSIERGIEWDDDEMARQAAERLHKLLKA